MKVLKYLGLFLLFILLILLTPFTQEKIYEKAIAHYLHLDSQVKITDYTPYHYALDIHLEDNSTLQLSLRHNLYQLNLLTVTFNGDVEIFSKTAEQKLPHLKLSLSSNLVNKNNTHLIGSLELNTSKEQLKLSAISISRDLNDTHAKYALNIKELSDTTYPLPKHLHGALEAKGELAYINNVASLSSDLIGGRTDILYDEKTTKLKLTKANLQKILRFSPKAIPIEKGDVDLYVDFKTPSLLKADIKALDGVVDLNLSALDILGINVDDSISKLVATQNLSLYHQDTKDNKTQEFDDDNRTHIQNMRLNISLKDEKIHCLDCAVATAKHLIAINGNIDLQAKAFENFEVGIVDDRHCAYYVQAIKGTFEELDIAVGKAGLDIISGSVLSLGSNLGDLTHSGGKLFSTVGDFTAKSIDFVTSSVPVVDNGGHHLSNAIRKVGDSGESLTSKVSSEKCTPFYTGVLTR